MKKQNAGLSVRTVDEMCEGASPVNDSEHFIVCPECGQVFDCREEASVRHHAQRGHKALLAPH